jgi:hypothetical protein
LKPLVVFRSEGGGKAFDAARELLAMEEEEPAEVNKHLGAPFKTV